MTLPNRHHFVSRKGMCKLKHTSEGRRGINSSSVPRWEALLYTFALTTNLWEHLRLSKSFTPSQGVDEDRARTRDTCTVPTPVWGTYRWASARGKDTEMAHRGELLNSLRRQPPAYPGWQSMHSFDDSKPCF